MFQTLKYLVVSLWILSTFIPVGIVFAQGNSAQPQSVEPVAVNQERTESVTPEPTKETPEESPSPEKTLDVPSNVLSSENLPAVGSLPDDKPVTEAKPVVEENPGSPTDLIPGQIKKEVKAVEVEGNKSIGLATILAKIKTRVGQDYNQAMISDDLKRLYNTGYFSDVSVDRKDMDSGFQVTFIVVEKEIVDGITFSKLKFMKPGAILSKIKTAKGKFLDNKMLNDDIRTIEELYAKKGLSQAKVSVETQRDEINNKVSVHFVVKEGYRVKIKNILVDGAETFPRKRILKIIKSRYAWLFNSGYLKTDVLDEDMDRIKAFYEKEGFIDATATYDIEELSESKRLVNIHINEGQRYYVEQITLVGNKIMTNDQVFEVMKEITEKGVFSRDKLTVDISNIRSLYFDAGYIFVNVVESTSLNPKSGKVDVRLDITEGDLAYINQIKIQGNDRTRDIVIRREVRLFPGDRFDGSKLRRTKERLRNLGYFEDVNFDIEDTDNPTKKDLVVMVKEAKTGSFSFGAGYSTVDQFVGFAEVEQKNFDFANWPSFTGGGQNLSMRLESGSTRSNTRLSFTEPWLFDYPISAGFDAYITKHDKEQSVGYGYNEKRVGGDLRLGRRFGEYTSGGVTYRRENIEIDDFDDNVSADLKAEEGKNTLSLLGFNVATDFRDSSINPTKGLYLSGGIDFAGGYLGGDKDFYRLSTRDSYSIPFKFDSVLEFRLRAGIQDAYGDSNKVPIFERFYAGGERTIRGYDERAVGPVDPTTNDPIGGESMLVGNIEYTIPVINFVKLAGFVDSGNVWSKMSDIASGGFKTGAGFGLRVKTPIGPVNLDYGFPFDKVPGDQSKTGKFYFSVSRGF
ncbi:MAG: outer membrane protein assembly factor BamA [Candidatus Omnitrophica bacterium]|nr:outer membrane protein assembly factor BamA [Candidatus Omnitrophota bacterium]